MSHIAIIGFMGSGKTRVGKALSKGMELPFVDVDRLVSKKMNMTVRDLYTKFGEPFYRALETTVVKELLADPEPKIISLSAAFPIQSQNEELMKKMDTVLYIKGSFDVLMERLNEKNSNHIAVSENREEKLKKLLKSYAPVYEKFATVTAETGVMSFEAFVESIEEKLK